MSTDSFHSQVAPLSARCLAGVVLLLTTTLLLGCAESPPSDESALYVRNVEGNVFDTTPVYGDVQSLRLRRTGFEYKCSECHTDFEHTRASNRPEGEHAQVLDRFDHGRNVYCMSCHNLNDRDSYVDSIGQPLSAQFSELLCARCHGTKFRDWEDGSHGRTNGHWDERFGERIKLTCVQCHDPHRPKFPQMKPSRPPIRSRLDSSNATLKGNEHD